MWTLVCVESLRSFTKCAMFKCVAYLDNLSQFAVYLHVVQSVPGYELMVPEALPTFGAPLLHWTSSF